MGKFVITITDLGTYDGTYDIELPFTNIELHTVKEISGVRAGEIGDAIAAADNDLCVALAVVALERANKTVSLQRLWTATTGKLKIDIPDDDEEDTASPPEPTPTPTPPDEPGSQSETDVEPGSSGSDSSDAGDRSPSDPSPTGSPPSGTGADSDREISEP